MKKRPDPAAACRCFTPEDALRYALAAYYAASRDIEPPEGEPFVDAEGVAYAGPAEFVEAFLQEIGRWVYTEAVRAGIELETGSLSQCPDALALVLRQEKRFVEVDLSALENDSLPLRQNRAHNHSGSGERD